jgi:transcriptional regulator with GAF, ATPase, and Fis domain
MREISNLQKLTSAISASMVMATSDTLDGEIMSALEKILASLDIDRVALLEVKKYSPVVNVAYAQYAEGIPHVPKQVDLAALFPWAYDHIVNKRKIMIMNSTNDLPVGAEVDRCSHLALGNKSTLAIPLFVGSRVHHLLTLDVHRRERFWPEDVVTQTRLLGEIFVSALQRREAETSLRLTTERLDVAAASADAGLWELNLETGVFWTTDKAKEHFGFDSGVELTLSRLMEEIHPVDRAQVLAKVEEARHSREELVVEYRVRLGDGKLRWLVSRGRTHRDDSRNADFLFGATVDVTRAKELELQLQAQILETERLSQQLLRENIYLREAEGAAQQGEILGSSDAMRIVMTQIGQVARTGSTVLLQGETGTGKGLVAQTIHRLSDRGKRVMVKVNCAALPGPLVESELFGREKGAYTGALSRQPGRFELADGSTLFLDEIAEMSLETQAKLLRVLQDSEFERLGSSKTTKVDVRIIAASNKDLAKEVEAGRFRGDLYYRLNIFPIHVPPLRERPEDIPQLVWEFIKEFGERMGKQIRRIAQKDMQLLTTYSWPGNIRELRNVIEHSLIISPGEVLVLQRLTSSSDTHGPDASLEDVERRHIQAILTATRGRIKGPGGAAERLAINPSTLYSRMRKLGIAFKHV